MLSLGSLIDQTSIKTFAVRCSLFAVRCQMFCLIFWILGNRTRSLRQFHCQE
jgi:hypothetical protein